MILSVGEIGSNNSLNIKTFRDEKVTIQIVEADDSFPSIEGAKTNENNRLRK